MKNYQITYNENQEVRSITMVAFNIEMAKQLFNAVRPECPIIHIEEKN